MNQLHVYGEYYIEFDKYPRKDENTRINDIILITYFMHEEYLKKGIHYYPPIVDHNEQRIKALKMYSSIK